MTDDGTWTCPGCGLPDEELPVGHSLAVPMNGDAPSCSVDFLAVFDAACEAVAWAPPLSPQNVRPEIVLYPGDIGKLAPFLHGVFRPEPEPGPPWTHTFTSREPAGEDEDGNPLYPPPGASHTFTERPPAPASPPALDRETPAWLAKAGAECRARPRVRRLPRYGYDYGVTPEADRFAERILADYRMLARLMPSPSGATRSFSAR